MYLRIPSFSVWQRAVCGMNKAITIRTNRTEMRFWVAWNFITFSTYLNQNFQRLVCASRRECATDFRRSSIRQRLNTRSDLISTVASAQWSEMEDGKGNRFNDNDILDSYYLHCPEGAAAQSPGLPLRLPWELKKKSFSTARRLCQYGQNSNGVATALRL